MSHTTSIAAVKITNIQALRLAISELATQGIRISLEENAKPRAYFENQQGMGVADFVVRIPDAAYDIGLYKDPDGGYVARTDFHAGSVERVLGAKASSQASAGQAKLGRLYQAYALNAATLEARKKGYMVTRVPGADGTVNLRMMLPATA